MTQPTETDSGHLEDLWRPESSIASTQPLPLGVPDADPVQAQRFGSIALELLLATLVSVGVAAAMGWSVLTDLSRVIPGAGPDPYLELWSLAWSGHALNPGSGIALTQLFDGNAFAPADYSLAFADSLLGYGPITWFFHGAAGLVTAYNLIFVFAPALSSLGGYALARQLGAHPIGAMVAGAGFAYAPWHVGWFSQLHLLSTGGVVIALAMLARGHGLTMSGGRSRPRPSWVLLGWLVGAWQLTLGFALGLPFAYLLALSAVLVLLITPVRSGLARRRQAGSWSEASTDPYPDVPGFAAAGTVAGRPGRALAVITPQAPRRTGRLFLADLLGGGMFAAVGALMTLPYLRAESIDPQAIRASHGLEEVVRSSARPLALVTPPAVDGTWSWLTGGPILAGTTELRLLPGAVLLVLAVLGLAVSTWRWWWRLTLLLLVIALAALGLGTRFPDPFFPGSDSPFLLVRRILPIWAPDRTPLPYIVFATLALALLAAGALSRLCGRRAFSGRGRAPGLGVLVLLVLPILIVLEGWVRIPLMPVPEPPAALTQAVAPMVVLPSVASNDSRVMFWTATRGFPEVGNGQSGMTPTTLVRMRSDLAGFPDARSVAYLRANGFRSVVVLRPLLGADQWPDADRVPDPSLGLTRQDLGESVLYRLGPP